MIQMDLPNLLCIFAGLYLVLPAAGVNIELQSYNLPHYYVRTAHRLHGGRVTIGNQEQPEIWNMFSPGLCNLTKTVTFCIGTNSNVCLRHRNVMVYAESNNGSRAFALDACFYLRAEKWFPGHVAFESVNYPGRYLRHQWLQLKLHNYISTALYEKDASFRILDPNCKKYRSYNLGNY